MNLNEQPASNLQILKDAAEAPDEGGLVTCEFLAKGLDVTKRTCDFVASTDIIDAHGDVVEQTWLLDDFLKNPVILFAHNSRELPIGRAVDVAVRGGQLECRIEFATEEMNPKAEQVWKMVQGKFLRAVSVGFIPLTYRWEMREGKEILVYSQNRLKEISVTPVPANPEALAKMKAKALAERPTTTTKTDITPVATVVAQATQKETIEMEKELAEKLDKQAVTIAQLNAEKSAVDAKLAEQTAKTVETTAKLASITIERDALTAQNGTLVTERDAAVARALEAESKLVDQEVSALVGEKILPAEKEMFVELRKSNPALFTKMIDQRQSLNLDKALIATKNEENGTPRATDQLGTDDVLDEVMKLGNA